MGEFLWVEPYLTEPALLPVDLLYTTEPLLPTESLLTEPALLPMALSPTMEPFIMELALLPMGPSPTTGSLSATPPSPPDTTPTAVTFTPKHYRIFVLVLLRT